MKNPFKKDPQPPVAQKQQQRPAPKLQQVASRNSTKPKPNLAAQQSSQGGGFKWPKFPKFKMPTFGRPAKVTQAPQQAVRRSRPVPPNANNGVVVSKDRTPFYAAGPSRNSPPDGYLKRGTVITLVKRGWSWSNVQLPSGQFCAVSSDSLRKASSSELARAVAASKPKRRVAKQTISKPKRTVAKKKPADVVPKITAEEKAAEVAKQEAIAQVEKLDKTSEVVLDPNVEAFLDPLLNPTPNAAPKKPELPAMPTGADDPPVLENVGLLPSIE